jgi:flavin reductase (DIM6/NTAB) family NADH-FMN oxidoreductase RutF
MIRDMASGDLGRKTNFGALLRNAHFAVLLAVAAMLATQTGCVSPAGMAQDTAAEAESEQMTTAAQVEALQAEVAALETEVAAAQAATGTAQTMAAQAHEEAGDAQAAAGAAQDQIAGIEAESTAAIAAARATAASAQDQVDMMMAEAHRASAVMIAAGQIDPNLLNFDSAQVFLAGPESIYISSIGYGDDTFSALLRYRGGTTATIEHIFGSAGKLIPDSVDLSHTELTLVAPDTLEVAFVGVGGNGYTGQLRYTGDNRLQVAGIRVVTLPPTAEELVAAAEARADAAIAEARAAADAAVAAAEARLAAVETESAADIADAQAAVDAARDTVDMMMAAAHRPSTVTIDADRIDPSLLNLDHARVSLAGPESIYVAGIRYGDDTYSALMRYRGGTTATVDKVFGPAGKLIPDSVDLSHTELALIAPNVLDVANVGVGGKGYSGQLRYAGDNRFELVGLTPVKLPPTAQELMAQTEARAAASIAEARAAADASAAEAEAARAAVAEAENRLAAVEAASAAAIADAQAAVDAARDKVDMMMAAAHRPSTVTIDADRIDPSLLNLDHARVSLAGPESIYVAGIRYGDDTYSALMRYRGGTTATVDKVFGPAGKLIPDSVDLSHTELALIAPNVLDVANVGVGGKGYSGQLRYAGDNRFELVGLTPVKLPPTAQELMAQTEARAAASIAEARAAADASAAEAEAARAAVAEAENRLAAVEAASAADIADAQAAVDAAHDKVDMLMAEAHRPSVVMISADQIDAGLLNLDAAQVSLAGPESVYISSIRYAGDNYSALLRYRGGTTATVENIYGPTGKLIPDSVDLSQTELTLIEPDIVDVAYVGVGRTGYSGQLRYAGDNRLEVVGIRPVTLPPTADELVAAARAQAAAGVAEARASADVAVAGARTAADSAVAEARAAAEAAVAAAETDAAAAKAAAAAARAEIEALKLELAPMGGVVISGDLDMRRLNLDAATVSVAGPDSIYVSGIGYGMKDYAVRLRHESGYTGVAEKLYDTADGIMPALDLSAPAVTAVARDTLVISNVGIGGEAYAVSFQALPDGMIVITPRSLGHRVRTAAELMRDELVAAPAGSRVVHGFAAGAAQPDEGAWTVAGGRVSQTDPGATHAKFGVHNVPQADRATLYGVTAYADAAARAGLGLHFLASGTPRTANTWNYGNSYLVWITQEVGFYDTGHAHVQLYQSLDGNRLMWLNSTKIARSLDTELTLEALYQPGDCPPMAAAGSCAGSISVFVDGTEQFKVMATGEVSAQAADTVALRTLGGPVYFLDLYVVSAE